MISAKIGDFIKATVYRPYNGHTTTIFGEVIAVTFSTFRVRYESCRHIDFLQDDIGNTVFFTNKEGEVLTMDLKDNGERRDFGTGAVRDISDGKGRCDLLPLSVLSRILMRDELNSIEHFKRTKNTAFLNQALCIFADNEKTNLTTLMLEVSIHFEDGAKKYCENNWMKGMPLHCYIDSGVRHFLKHLRGDTDEPHDRAFVWNMLCAYWTYDTKPELDDILKGIEFPNVKYDTLSDNLKAIGKVEYKSLADIHINNKE
jgi:hypothetical protein